MSRKRSSHVLDTESKSTSTATKKTKSKHAHKDEPETPVPTRIPFWRPQTTELANRTIPVTNMTLQTTNKNTWFQTRVYRPDNSIANSWDFKELKDPIQRKFDRDKIRNEKARRRNKLKKINQKRLERNESPLLELPEEPEEAATKTHEPRQVRIIEVYPTPAQKKVINQWIKGVNFTYNAGVKFLKDYFHNFYQSEQVAPFQYYLKQLRISTRSYFRHNMRNSNDEKMPKEQQKAIAHAKATQQARQFVGFIQSIASPGSMTSVDPNMKASITATVLRHHMTGKKSLLLQQNPWLTDIPMEVRDTAVLDLYQGYVNRQKLQYVQPKARIPNKLRDPQKRLQSSINIRSRFYNGGALYKTFWVDEKNIPLPPLSGQKAGSEKDFLPDNLPADSRLVRTKAGRYFLHVPYPIQIQQPKVIGHMIALDPGCRTFLTGYDPINGCITEWAPDSTKSIQEQCARVDRVQRIIQREAETKQGKKARRRRRHLRKLMGRMSAKVKNKIRECHNKVSLDLVRTYEYVLLPDFKTSKMVRKQNRKIRKSTARQLMAWAHYRFKETLMSKAERYRHEDEKEQPSCQVIEVTEEYTSKTCGRCGLLNQKLGSSKVFDCPHCSISMDRDHNAARNIFLKYLTATTTNASS